jgi:hypothetical protein
MRIYYLLLCRLLPAMLFWCTTTAEDRLLRILALVITVETYFRRVVTCEVTSFVCNFCGMFYRRQNVERWDARRWSDKHGKGLEYGMMSVLRSTNQLLTSGRCCNTGSLRSNLKRRMEFIVGDDTAFICCTPSSSQALIKVLRASSPLPNSASTAVSGSGSVWGVGRARTERASASRVKPCVLTRGTASFSRCALSTSLAVNACTNGVKKTTLTPTFPASVLRLQSQELAQIWKTLNQLIAKLRRCSTTFSNNFPCTRAERNPRIHV